MSTWKVFNLKSSGQPIVTRILGRNYIRLSYSMGAQHPPICNGYLENDTIEAGLSTGTSVLFAAWRSDFDDPDYFWTYRECVAVMGSGYIYYVKPNVKDAVVVEYNIATQETIEITVYITNQQEKEWIYGVALSYLENRKVLFWCDNDYDWSKIYRLDFANETKEIECEYNYPQTVFTFQKANNSILIFSMGWNSNDDWTLYYKDWTNAGSWTSITLEQETRRRISNNPIFLDEDYLCWFQTYDGSPPTIKGCALNLNDFTMSYSSALGCSVAGPATSMRCLSGGVDYIEQKIYGSASGWVPYFPPYGYGFSEIFEYDPATGNISSIYGYYTDLPPYLYVISSSPGHAYAFGLYQDILYELPSMTEKMSMGSTSGVLAGFHDVNGIISYKTNGILSIGASDIALASWAWNGSNTVGLLHTGNGILVCLFTDVQTPFSRIHDFTVRIYYVH